MTTQQIITDAIYNGGLTSEFSSKAEVALKNESLIPSFIADAIFDGGVSGVYEKMFMEIYKECK